MTYWVLKYYSSRDRMDLFTRTEKTTEGKIMLFPSREDAEMYRDAYYGPQGRLIHKVVELEVENAAEKPGSYKLMTAIHEWEKGQQR